MKALPRVLVALLALRVVAPAYDFSALKHQGFVSDFANVVDPRSRAELERYCAHLESATGVQLAFVTLQTLHGEPVEDVAGALFRAWGVGKKGKDEGVLFLLAVTERRSRLEVGYGLEATLPDGAAGGLLRGMRPALRVGHYGDALIEAARSLGNRIASAKGIEFTDTPRPQKRRPPESRVPWGLLAGAVVLLFVLARASAGPGSGGSFGGGLLSGMLLGGLAGRAFQPGRGSGGFGGYDSGGGFGGFGGGDSGGGGASSDW